MIRPLFFVLSVALGAAAAPPAELSRRSSILLGADAGNNQFAAARMEGLVGLDSHWGLIAQTAFIHNSTDLNSAEGVLGLDYLAPRKFSASLTGTYRRGPRQLNTLSTSLETGAWLNRMWGADTATALFATVGFTRFSEAAAINRLVIVALVRQLSVAARLSQEVFSWLTLGASFSYYNYDRSPDTLSARLSNPRFAASGLGGAASGFPRSISTVRALFFFSDAWSGDASLSFSRFVVDANGDRSLALGTSLQYQLSEAWMLGLQASSVRYADEKRDYSAGIEAEYSWE